MNIARQEAFSTLNKGIMNFPESHMWNKGGVFTSVNFEEWYTWNGVLKDSKTDELYSLYISFYQIVKDGKLTYPYAVSLYNVKTNTLHSMLGDCPKLTTHGNKSNDNFSFQYEVPKHWSVSYLSNTDSWELDYKLKHDKLNFNLKLASDSKKNYWSSADGVLTMGKSLEIGYKPDKMTGLAFSYFNPFHKAEGSFQIEDKELELQGNLWFSHQWGNFRNNNFNYETFNTFNLVFNENFIIDMKNWFDKGGKEDPELNGLVVYKDGQVPRYFKGSQAYKLSAQNDVNIEGKHYSLDWCLEFDTKTYYLSPYSKDQLNGFVDRKDGSFWEGFGLVREGSSHGPTVGTVFMEIMGR